MPKPTPPAVRDESLQDLVQHVEQREQQKEDRRRERAERQAEKAQQKSQALKEKFVAPILLILTVVASAVVWLLAN